MLGRCLIILFAVLLSANFSFAEVTESEWTFQQLPIIIGSTGAPQVDIDIDDNGSTHMVVTKGIGQEVIISYLYRPFTGAEWQTEDIEVFKWGSYHSIAIAVDIYNRPHIVYHINFNIIHAVKHTDGTWQKTSLGTNMTSPNITTDSSGLPHIVYSHRKGKELRYAKFDGTSWDEQIVATGGYGFSTRPTIAVDDYGVPHIAFITYKLGFYHAEPEGSGWEVTKISDGLALRVSIDVDSKGTPYVLCNASYRRMFLAFPEDSGWNISYLPFEGEAATFPKKMLKLDDFDDSHIAFILRGYVYYANLQDNQWNRLKLDGGSYTISMTLDRNGWPKIVYFKRNRFYYLAEYSECSAVPAFEIESIEPQYIWPPNHKEKNITISGNIVLPAGCTLYSASYRLEDEYGQYTYDGELVANENGEFILSLPVEAWRNGNDKDGRAYSILLFAEDEAGIGTTNTIDVIVPHDQRKNNK